MPNEGGIYRPQQVAWSDWGLPNVASESAKAKRVAEKKGAEKAWVEKGMDPQRRGREAILPCGERRLERTLRKKRDHLIGRVGGKKENEPSAVSIITKIDRPGNLSGRNR